MTRRFELYAVSLGMLLLLIVVISILSCEKIIDSNTDCSDCRFPEPKYGYLKLTFSDLQLSSGLPFVVYEGKMEENNIILIDTSYSTTFYVEKLTLNKHYTVKAKYSTKEGGHYNVLDGSEIKSKYSNTCNDECWLILGAKINLEVKYEDILE